MKKVLIFSLSYYPYVGGAEIAIKEITDRINPEEMEFHLLTLRNDRALPKEEKIGNVHVHRIGLAIHAPTTNDFKKLPLRVNKYLFELLAPLTAHALHRKHAFDATWAMMAHSSGIPAGLFKLWHPDVRYLLTLQEGDPIEDIEKSMRFVWPLFTQGFTRADALQAISNFLRDWGVRMGFSGETHVVPNGVAVEEFTHQYTDTEVAQTKEILGKKEGDVFLVTTSRLVHKNGIDVVIRALASLPTHISFLVYGTGSDEAMLKALAVSCGVEDRVRFMGQIDHKDMPLMLSCCDLFIRPSRSEGMGNSFIEAMARGLPVIATLEGGIADFLYDARTYPDTKATGWAVTKDSPEEIVTVVREILEKPEVVAAVTKNAKDMVVRKYNWSTISLTMKELFTRMIETSSTKR